MGRPLKFKSIEELQEKIDSYFKECDDNNSPYTITGLALALDTSRRVLVEYENKEKYSNTIKKAKMKCENYAENKLYGSRQVAGVIFSLKNNYGWKDKSESEVTHLLPKPLLDNVRNNNSTKESAEDEKEN